MRVFNLSSTVLLLSLCGMLVSQRTSYSSSNCVYTFYVPRNDISQTCPNGTGHEDTEVLKQEISQLKTAIMNMQQQLTTSGATVANMQQQLTTSGATVANMQQQLTTSNKALEVISATLANVNDNTTVGVNYIHYGHKSCPDTAKVLYDGFVGKSYYSHKGGGANYLCLPRHPEWPSGVTSAFQSSNYIYGVEYQKYGSPLVPSSVNQNDVPCAVCDVTGRSQKIMIPAKLTCPTEWTLEYKGVLMAEHSTHTKSDFICVDSEMQTLTGGGQDVNGGLVYVVEAKCGPLPCPPYVDGYELGCVVCSK